MELSNVGYMGMCHRPGFDFSLPKIQNKPQILNFFSGTVPGF